MVELIKEGQRKGIWDYKYPMTPEKPWWDIAKNDPVPAAPVETKKEPVPVAPVETKKEPVPVAEVKEDSVTVTADRTKVYTRLSKLEGPSYGPFNMVPANSTVTVKDTEYKDVVEITTELGVKGYIKRDRLTTLHKVKDLPASSAKGTEIPLAPSKKDDVPADIAAKEGVVK